MSSRPVFRADQSEGRHFLSRLVSWLMGNRPLGLVAGLPGVPATAPALAAYTQPAARRARPVFEPLEPRLLLSADPLSYTVAAGTAADLELRLVSDDDGVEMVQLVDRSGDTPEVVVEEERADVSTVEITGAELDDVLRIDDSVVGLADPLSVTFTGGGGSDTLEGGDADATWTLTGAGAGQVGDVTFSGIDAILGGGGEDTLATPAGVLTLEMTEQNAGTVSGIAFDGIEHLSGQSGQTLSYAGYASEVYVNLADGEATGLLSVSGFSHIIGSDQDDVLLGDANANVIDAGDGDDIVGGGAGVDTLSGGAGTNTLYESRDADMVLTNTTLTVGSDGADSHSGFTSAILEGGASGNTLDASAFSLGSVSLSGGDGADILRGGDGDDDLSGGGGADQLFGGGGINRVVETRDADMTLTDTTLVIGAEGTDALADIQGAALTGGDGDNTIDASAFTLGDVSLDGGDGDDDLTGGSGDDSITGGLGIDTIAGGGGSDTLVEEQDTRFVLTDTTLDAGEGTSEQVTLTRTGTVSGGDFTLSYDGETTIAIAHDADATEVKAALVRLDGLSDEDIAVTETADGWIIELIGDLAGIDLPDLSASSSLTGAGAGLSVARVQGLVATNSLTSIERAELTGGASGNTIDASGFSGSVVISGGDGNDTLIGGSAADIISGGYGSDRITGNAGADTIDGGDSAEGFSDIDTLVESRDADMTLTTTTLVVGSEGTDTLTEIETAELTGGASANTLDASGFDPASGLGVTLDGAGGDDVLTGTDNDDTLTGGSGADDIDGGGGDDTLVESHGHGMILTDAGFITFDSGGSLLDVSTLTSIEAAILAGGSGAQTIQASGFSGDATIYSGGGLDTINGGGGDDRIIVDVSNVADGGSKVQVTGNGGDDTLVITGVGATLEAAEIARVQQNDDLDLEVDGGASLTVSENIALAGQDFTLKADNLTVSGATIDTGDASGQAGSITLEGMHITVEGATRLLALGADSTQDGDISILATDDETEFSAALGFANIDKTDADVTVSGTTEIRGRDVAIKATAGGGHYFNPSDLGEGDLATYVGSALNSLIGVIEGTSLFFGLGIAESDAQVDVGTDVDIHARDFAVHTSSIASVTVAPISYLIGVAIGLVDTVSKATFAGTVNATGDVTVRSSIDNSINVVSDSFGVKGVAGAVAVSVLGSDATAKVTDDAVIHAGDDVTVQADTIDRNRTMARSTSGSDGKVGISVAVSVEEGDTNAYLDGTVTAAGDVVVNATQEKQSVDVNRLFLIPGVATGVTSAAAVGSNSTGDLLEDAKYSATRTATAALTPNISGFLQTKGPDFIKNLLNSAPSPASNSFDAAGAVTVVSDINRSEARIGDGDTSDGSLGADVEAMGSVTVSASNSNRPDYTAGASASNEVSDNPINATTPEEAAFGGSVAVVVGIVHNDPTAYIASDADVDAVGDITVSADALNEIDPLGLWGANLIAPFFGDDFPDDADHKSSDGLTTVSVDDTVEVSDNHSAGGDVGTWYKYLGASGGSNPADQDLDLSTTDFTSDDWEEIGSPEGDFAISYIRTVTTYLDSNLGLDNNLVDTWSQATVDGQKIGIAGSLTVLVMDQDATATIEDGARINQDGVFQTANPSSGKDVKVAAKSVDHTINLGGNFQTPGVQGSTSPDKKSWSNEGGFQSPGAGTTTGKGNSAAGLGVQVFYHENTALATIEDGVILGADSLAVTADNQIVAVSFAASGGKAGNVGFNGAFQVTVVENTTRAQIDNGAEITVGSGTVDGGSESLLVQANDAAYLVSISGGVAVSEGTGVGASVAVNAVTRDTEAVIGNLRTDDSVGTRGFVTVGGKSLVDASNEGFVGAFAVAAAVSTASPAETPSNPGSGTGGTQGSDGSAQSNADLTAWQTQWASVLGEMKSSGKVSDNTTGAADQGAKSGQNQAGIGVSGSLTINIMNDDARAYVLDTGTVTVTGDELEVYGHNDTLVLSIAGSASYAKGSGTGSSTGVSGAFGINTSVGNTEAYVDGATSLDLDGLNIHAERTGTIVSIVAGFAGATGQSGVAVGGSVAVNVIDNVTESGLRDTTGTVDGNVTVKADDNTYLILVAGSGGFGGRAGVGVGIAFNWVDNEVYAKAEDLSDFTHHGNLKVDAESSGLVITVAGSVGVATGGGGGDGTAVSGTLSLNFVDNTIEAALDDSTTLTGSTGDVAVEATDSTQVYTFTGALASGKSAGFGLALAFNYVTNSVTARVDGTTLRTTGSFMTKAEEDAVLVGLGVAGSGAEKLAVSGAVAVNRTANETTAQVTGASDVKVGGDIEVSADDKSLSVVVAGGLAFAKTTAVGAGVGVNLIENSITAEVVASTLETTGADKTLEVLATAEELLVSVVIGGAGAQTVAIGGAVSVNAVENTINARVTSASDLDAVGDIAVRADDATSMVVVAGAGAGAQTTAVGAAVSTTQVETDVFAKIDASEVTSSAGSVAVTAGFAPPDSAVAIDSIGVGTGDAGLPETDTEGAQIFSLTITGSGAGTFAGAGSVSLNWIRKSVEASITNGSTVIAAGDIFVMAADSPVIRSIAGQVSISGSVAAGVAIAYNDIQSDTKAFIDGSSTRVEVLQGEDGNIGITADSTPEIFTIAAGVAVGSGAAGVAGSSAASLVENETWAYIEGATVTTDNNILIEAENDDTVQAYVGTLGGSSTVGVGGSVVVNQLKNETLAYITGDATVQARNDGDEWKVDKAWDTNNDADEVIGDLGGLAVIATSTETLTTISVAGGAAGQVGVGLNTIVNIFEDTTRAYIHDSAINTDADEGGEVNVRAHFHADVLDAGGALGVGLGIAGVGAAVSTDILDNETTAYISDDADLDPIYAGRGLVVSAVAREDITTASVGVGGGLYAGVAGAASAVDSSSTTQAYIQRAEVETTGGIDVYADSRVAVDFGVGAGAIGAVGAGGSVAVGLFSGETKAYVVGSELRAKGAWGDVNVSAHSEEAIFVFTGTASVGAGAYAGAVAVIDTSSTTQAWIGSYQSSIHSTVTAGGSVYVSAYNSTSTEDIAGSVAVGGQSAGAAVDVQVIKNTVVAEIGDGTTVNAADDVEVEAEAERDLNSLVIAGAGGATLGIAGGVSVVTVGTGIGDSDTGDEVDPANDVLSDTFSGSVTGLNSDDDDEVAARAEAAANANLAGVSGVEVGVDTGVTGTAARIGEDAAVTAGTDGSGNILVDALETLILDLTTGQGSVGGVASIGGSVVVASVGSVVTSSAGRRSTLSAPGTVDVDAKLDATDAKLNAYGGSAGGTLGLGAQVVVLTDTSVQAAYLADADSDGDGVQVVKASALGLSATADRDYEIEAKGVAAGGLAAGASIGRASIGGSTLAYLGSHAQVGQGADSVGSLSVDADSTVKVDADVWAVAAGIGAGAGNDATLSADPKVYAYVDAGSDISVTGAVGIEAAMTPELSAVVVGVSAGGLAVGVSLTDIDIAPDVAAALGDPEDSSQGGVDVDAASLGLTASTGLIGNSGYSGYAESQGVSGALIGVDSTNASIDNDSSVRALVGDDATLDLTGAVTVSADNDTRQKADANSAAGGVVAAGVATSHVSSDTLTSAVIGDGVDLIAGSVSVTASGSDENLATTTAGSGGVAAGAGAVADTTNDSVTVAAIGAGSSNRDFDLISRGAGTLVVSAAHTATFDNNVETLAIGVLGGTGAENENQASASVTASLGDDLVVKARDIDVSAENYVRKEQYASGDNIYGLTGGAAAGAGAVSETEVDLTTRVVIGDDADLQVLKEFGETAGDFELSALNDLVLKDLVHLETGGALAGAGSESSIKVLTDIASVEIGDGASLRSAGSMSLLAQGTAVLNAAVNQSTYGAGTVGVADTKAKITPTNQIEVGAGAYLRAESDLYLAAGSDGDFGRDRYEVHAETDTLAGSAIPVEIVDADAYLLATNTIDIAGGALLEAGGDARLHADFEFGKADVIGRAKATSWVTALGDAINGDTAEQLVEGSVLSEAKGSVEMDGTVRTGVNRHQAVVIDQWDVAGQTAGHREFTLDPSSAVSGDVIDFGGDHGFAVGELVQYDAGGGLAIGGLVDGQAYFAIVVDASHLRLAETADEAIAGTAITLDKTQATGSTHGFSAKSDGISYTAGLAAKADDLITELQYAEEQLATYSGLTGITINQDLVDFYESEVDRLKDLLEAEGLIDYPDPDDTSIWFPVTTDVVTITIDEVTAEAGLIDVRTGQLMGSGVFDSPRDASVTIINHTPGELVITGIEIPDSNGGLWLNGYEVDTNGEIEDSNEYNADLNNRIGDDPDVEVGDADFQGLPGAGGGDLPEIYVENTFNRLGFDSSSPFYDPAYPDATYANPDLTVTGPITNILGDVSLITTGDLLIQAQIRSGGDLNLQAGGSVYIIGLTSYEIAGREIYGELKTAFGTTGLMSGYNATSVAGLLNTGSSDVDLMGDRIVIDANYININGIMQSGKDSYELTIDPSDIPTWATSQSSGKYLLSSISDDDIVVYFNAGTRQIEVEEITTGGGYVDLTGHILSSSPGEIRVLGGYADIDVTNNTDYSLKIKGLDASTRGTGTLIIKDKTVGGSENPKATIYQQGADGTVTRVVSGGGVTGGTDTVSASSTYETTDGWRWGFNVYQQQATTRYWEENTSTWLGIDALAPDPDNDAWDREEPAGPPTLTDEGPFYFQDNSDSSAYSFESEVVDSQTGDLRVVEKYTKKTWYGKKTYYATFSQKTTVGTMAKHSVAADKDIRVSFIGNTSASVDVTSTQSGADVIIDGDVRNPSGTTMIDSAAGIESDGGDIGGMRIELTAETGIDATLDLAGGNGSAVEARTETGDISLEEVTGDLTVDTVEAVDGGDVALSAPDGAIEVGRTSGGGWYTGQVTGGSITLSADGGAIGNGASRPLQIDSNRVAGSINETVTATAADDIHLRETLGDLYLHSATSAGGTVWIEVPNGALLDANDTAIRDDRAYDELLNGVWTNLRLTAGTGASDRLAETVSSYEATLEQEYQTYWSYRQQQPAAPIATLDTADLVPGQSYYVIVDGGGVKLAASGEDALNGVALDLDAGSATGTWHGLGTASFQFNVETQVDGAGETIRIEGQVFADGDAVTYTRDGDANDIGLEEGVTYYVQVSPGDPSEFALSRDAAGTDIVDLADIVPATAAMHRLYRLAEFTPDGTLTGSDRIDVDPAANGLSTGDIVVYSRGESANGSVQASTPGTLEDGATYYVILDAADGVRLAASNADALAGRAIDLVAGGAEGTLHQLYDMASQTQTTFDPLGGLDAADNSLSVGAGHGLVAGQAVVYLTSVYDATFNPGLSATEESDYRAFYTQQGADQGLSGGDLDTYVDDAITTLENKRAAEYHALHEKYGQLTDNSGNPNTYLTDAEIYEADFDVSLSSAEQDALTSGWEVWTEEQLYYAMGSGILKPVSDTTTTIEDPNVTGGDVTLSGDSGVGTTGSRIDIDLSGALTDEQRVALAAAERADVTFLSGDTQSAVVNVSGSAYTLTRIDGGVWDTSLFSVGGDVEIWGNSANDSKDTGNSYRIAAISGATITLDDTFSDGVTPVPLASENVVTIELAPVVLDPLDRPEGVSVTAIVIQQKEDVDLDASGEVSATSANGQVYLGSEQILQIASVTAAEDVRIKGQLDVLDVSGAGPAVTGDGLVIEAGDGSIGSSGGAFSIDLTATGTLTARADGSVKITEQTGDMNLESIYSATAEIVLTAAGGIYDALHSDYATIATGTDLELIAQTGGIGTDTDPVETDVASSGSLTASAVDDIVITETSGDMNLRRVAASAGDVILVSDGSIFDPVDFDGTDSGARPQADIVGRRIMLQAGAGGAVGTIGASGNDVDIDTDYAAGGTLTAEAIGFVYLIETDGDLGIDTVGTESSYTAFIAAPTGSIFNARGDGGSNVTGGKLWLFAADDIGTDARSLFTEVGVIEGQATSGSVYIENAGALGVGGVTGGSEGITAGDDVEVITESPITVLNSILAGGDVLLVATDDADDGAPGGGPGDVEDIILGGPDHLIVNAVDLLGNPLVISATSGRIQLLAGDDLILEEGATIEAAARIDLAGDYAGNPAGIPSWGYYATGPGADPGQGAIIDLHADILAPYIYVWGGNDADTIVVPATAEGTLTDINTFLGEDLAHVGSAATVTTNTGGELDSIRGFLDIDLGYDRSSRLVLDNSGEDDPGPRSGLLSSTILKGLGMGAGESDTTSFHGIALANVGTLELSLGELGAQLTVAGTPWGSSTRIQGGAGTDNVTVFNPGGDFYLDTAGGDDNVTLNAVAKHSEVHTGSGNDSLALNITVGDAQLDTGDGDDRVSGRISVADVNLDTGTGADNVDLQVSIGSLDLATGADGDSVRLSGIFATLDIDTGAGDDSFDARTIGGNATLRSAAGDDQIAFNALLGALDIHAGAGNDDIALTTQIGVTSVVDAGDGDDRLEATRTDGNTELRGGLGADTFAIHQVSGTTRLLGEGGDDQFLFGRPGYSGLAIADRLAGTIQADGGTGADRMQIDDRGYGGWRNLSLDDDSLSGFGSASLGYAAMDELDILLGSGVSNVTVTDTHAGYTGIDTGAGNDQISVENSGGLLGLASGAGNDSVRIRGTGAALALDAGSGDDLIEVGGPAGVGAIDARLSLVGGSGADRLRVLNNNTGTATLSDAEITGLGMARGIGYAEIETIELEVAASIDLRGVAMPPVLGSDRYFDPVTGELGMLSGPASPSDLGDADGWIFDDGAIPRPSAGLIDWDRGRPVP